MTLHTTDRETGLPVELARVLRDVPRWDPACVLLWACLVVFWIVVVVVLAVYA